MRVSSESRLNLIRPPFTTGAVIPPLTVPALPVIGGLGLSSPTGIVNTFENLIPENDLIDADACLPWEVLGEASADCQDDAGAGGVLADGDVCALVSAAAEVNAQCQQNTGVQARSLVNPNLCADLAALGTASGTCATGGGDGVIDIDVCAPLGVLGSASICPPFTTPTTTPGGPSTTPGGPQEIRNPSGSSSDTRVLGRMPQGRNH